MKKLILSIMFLCLSFLCFHSCSAEQVYYMTEQEVLILQQRLATLKQQRETLQQEFLMLKQQQVTLDKQAKILETQLAASKERSSNLETQLQTVNESFQQYSKEAKLKLRRTKLERNILIAGLLYGGYCYCRKH